MKILRIVCLGYKAGGIENGIALMQPLFEERGHIVKIFASETRPDLPHFNHYSYKIPPGGIGKIFYSFNPYSYITLKNVLKEFQPDIVDINGLGHASPSILFLLKKYPTVFTIHGSEGFTKSRLMWCFPVSDFKHREYNLDDLNFIGKLRYVYHQYVNRPLYWFGFRNVDIFITLSHYMHRLMEGDGIHNKYVPNGTILLDYKPLQKKNITNTLVYAGRLKKIKGVDYLLKALPVIIKKFPDVKLFIAGDGEERSNLERLTDDLNISNNVTFLGHIERKQLEKIYQCASVIVIPSVVPETFGLVGIEAMSVGRPVIASDVGGISDWLIHGQTGFLVPQKDSIVIAEAVTKIFSDHNMLLRMMRAARKKAEEFDLNKHIDQMENIYINLIYKYKKRKM